MGSSNDGRTGRLIDGIPGHLHHIWRRGSCRSPPLCQALEAHHPGVVPLRVFEQGTAVCKTPDFTAQAPQAYGQRCKVGIARGDGKKPYAIATAQFYRVGNQGSVCGVLVQRKIGQQLCAQSTPYGFFAQQVGGASEGAHQGLAARVAAHLHTHRVQPGGFVQVVGINQDGCNGRYKVHQPSLEGHHLPEHPQLASGQTECARSPIRSYYRAKKANFSYFLT